ncbi:hypothetical protein ISS30_06115 [bacterium]|nr:hypothetical protein [FCB group bacterium]MBL7191253.1 hypothetical protein [bacterium]
MYYSGGFSFHIIDVSDPANPFETGYYQSASSIIGIDVSGDYAYLAAPNDLFSEDYQSIIPAAFEYRLSQPYPNPFNAKTAIS